MAASSRFALLNQLNIQSSSLPRANIHKAASLIEALPVKKSKNTTFHLPLGLPNVLSLGHHLHPHPHVSTSGSSLSPTAKQLAGAAYSRQPNTPASSPREVIKEKWREIQGLDDWRNLLDPLHPWLRREIVKYGEFAQATYDAFDFDATSEYCGTCRYGKHHLFEKVGLHGCGYVASKYLYALSHVELPHWINRTMFGTTWSKESNWMGYVAVSDDKESERIGRRDIVVAWRGTVTPSEWIEDIQGKLEPVGDGDVRVEHGFLSIYKSKSAAAVHNRSSASEQAMVEVRRLVDHYRQRGEEVSLTITGHSLGGALALLHAYEAAINIANVPISVFTFGAPMVGNTAFRDRLEELQVRTLRVATKQDMVPKMPGVVFNEGLAKFEETITGCSTAAWSYAHVGRHLPLEVGASPYLKHGFDLVGFHSLETYLHLVDGFLSSTSPFRLEARRDVALVNKCCGMLRDDLRVPVSWYQLANKGLIRNAYGRWVQPSRDSDDIPSPATKVVAAC